MRVRIEFRSADAVDDTRASSPGVRAVLLGDGSESHRSAECMSNATIVEYDLHRRRLRIRTSIVGLPPVFLYKEPSRVVLASDLWSLRCWPGVSLAFDPHAVRDLCRIGYPVGFRTLFAGISVVPGGSVVEVALNGQVTVRRAWRMPEAAPEESWEAYTDFQARLFRDVVRGIDLRDSFLSLTAGLDTRTILAALLAEGKSVPAVTMSWKNLSLDARTARDLCRAYGIPHEIIRFDERFTAEFPGHALAASRLSGGLAGVGQATEVAFYHRIGGKWKARLSGNLGNQVGRGGVEQVSLRNGDLAMLGEGVVSSGAVAEASDHWFYGDDRRGAPLERLFSLQSETLFSSIGNYCIGHHFVVQRSPYASRRLIEALARAPSDARCRAPRSIFRIRCDDLHHRFLGYPAHRSFQRKSISAVGGYVAQCPINWGWRVRGGVSPKRTVAGLLTFLDALAASQGLDRSWFGRALETVRITGRYDFRQTRKWCSREFLRDTLLRREIRERGLLNVPRIETMLDEHFAGRRDHHANLMLALDLSCAQQVFLDGPSGPHIP